MEQRGQDQQQQQQQPKQGQQEQQQRREEPQLVVARGRGHCGADANGSSMASALNPRHKTRPPQA